MSTEIAKARFYGNLAALLRGEEVPPAIVEEPSPTNCVWTEVNYTTSKDSNLSMFIVVGSQTCTTHDCVATCETTIDVSLFLRASQQEQYAQTNDAKDLLTQMLEHDRAEHEGHVRQGIVEEERARELAKLEQEKDRERLEEIMEAAIKASRTAINSIDFSQYATNPPIIYSPNTSSLYGSPKSPIWTVNSQVMAQMKALNFAFKRYGK